MGLTVGADFCHDAGMMNSRLPAVLLLAGMAWGAFAGEEEAGLESVKRMRWVHRDYVNAAYGISVVVKERPKDQRRGDTWGSGSFDVIEENGRKVSVSVQDSDRETATIRVPLDAATMEHLLVSRDEPDYVRFIAASHIIEAALPVEKQVELLTRGIRQREASLRWYVWHELREFQPRERVAGLLHLALRDPCLEIAHDSLHSIVDEYGLVAEDGAALPVTDHWRGKVCGVYVAQHREIRAVARALRRVRPDLMPRDEMAALYARAMPSDAWFQSNSSGKEAEAGERRYFAEFAAELKAERERDLGPEPVRAEREGMR